MLDQYFQYEILNKSKNFYQCRICNKEGKNKGNQAIKRFYFYGRPLYLFISIKLGYYGGYNMHKANVQYNYQQTIDLTKYQIYRNQREELKYELVGVIEHQGSVSGGHYISFVKKGDNYFYISDSHFK